MTELERILEQFERAFDGDPWHGWPLMKLLSGITAGMAAFETGRVSDGGVERTR
jgi:hypothetical protein